MHNEQNAEVVYREAEELFWAAVAEYDRGEIGHSELRDAEDAIDDAILEYQCVRGIRDCGQHNA